MRLGTVTTASTTTLLSNVRMALLAAILTLTLAIRFRGDGALS
jgi:hypothetical protein